MNKLWVVSGYIIASFLFILGIKLLNKARSARLGNIISGVGMLLAIVTTLGEKDIAHFKWVLISGLLGTLVGLCMAIKVKMTSMPEMVALLNGFGGFASLLVGYAEGLKPITKTLFDFDQLFNQFTTVTTIWIGGITFTGSVVAYAKLNQRWLSGAPTLFKGQKLLSILTILLTVLGIYGWIAHANASGLILTLILSLLLGILVILPIGGGDMPVVISLLNSFSGMAACAAGLIIFNKVLIVAGCLVGTSGLILTVIMCKAMNRSLKNVLFGSFGAIAKASVQNSEDQKEPKAITSEDAYYILEAAKTVAFVPGYGMAVAQAQHVIKELAKRLEDKGIEVFYAIHPVAGRMPGHMNVLLAEADVPYEQLIEIENANQRWEQVDVAIVVGANDVVNPAAKEDKNSPIYGMPILEVQRAKNVFVLKRGKGKGFSGLENHLFIKENTRMLYGDAKATLAALAAEFKSE